MSADATTAEADATTAEADDAAAVEPEDGDASAPAPQAGGRRSVGPLIALGLALALVVAGVVVAIVGGDDVSATAVRVNTFEVSQKSFDAQLKDLAPVIRDQGATASEATDAFVPSSVAARLAQIYVFTELLRGHVDVSDADRRSVSTENAEELAAYPQELRDRLVELTVMQTNLVADRGDDGAQQVLRRLARRADVTVDPRYGFWNPTVPEVCAPSGCASASAGG